MGWFYESWYSGEDWKRVEVRADQCPRISAEFLAEEKEALGVRWYEMEYQCVFGDMLGSVFRSEDIERALDSTLEPMFP
jgi:hypothetical protein